MSDDHESTIISYSDKSSQEARSTIFNELKNYPGSEGETERSLGLFIRGSLLARMLAVGEIYEKIIDLPGVIFDIGTWRGQTAVLCENFRAIHEPMHMNRRIVCFDTFDGYEGFGDKDKPTDIHQDGTYGVGGSDYAEYLRKLLVLHETSNAMGHNNGKHLVIEGDCRVTIKNYFDENPNEFVSLAFFDVNSYEPTADAFKMVIERLVPGGVIAFWQLTRNIIPAEGTFYTSEVIQDFPHIIKRSKFYPGLCYLVKT